MSASGERSEAAINYKQVEVVEKHCLAAAHGLDSSSYGEISMRKFPVRTRALGFLSTVLVPHLSTELAQRILTSDFGWDLVHFT